MEPDETAPTAIDRYFFTPIYYPRSAWSVIGWWESRRPLYNVSVALTGLTSLSVMWIFENLPPSLHRSVPELRFVLAYGIMANLGYTLGAPLDLMLRRILGDRAPGVSQAMFRYGFVFALGLTALPIPLAVFSWIMRSIFG